MTFKGILEGTLRSDAETWVRQLMKAEGYKIRLIQPEEITFRGKNEQAVCHVEIWYGEFDQAGVEVVYNLDAYGIHRKSIYQTYGYSPIDGILDNTKKLIWIEENQYRHRASVGIDKFELTRREM